MTAKSMSLILSFLLAMPVGAHAQETPAPPPAGGFTLTLPSSNPGLDKCLDELKPLTAAKYTKEDALAKAEKALEDIKKPSLENLSPQQFTPDVEAARNKNYAAALSKYDVTRKAAEDKVNELKEELQSAMRAEERKLKECDRFKQSNTPKDQKTDAYEKWKAAGCDDKKNKSSDECKLLAQMAGGTASNDKCDEAKTKYSEAMGKFSAACSLGVDGCLNLALQCGDCRGEKLEPYCPGAPLADEEKRRQRAALLKGETLEEKGENQQAAAEILSCPQIGMNEVDDLKKDLEKDKKDKEDLENDLNEAVEDLQAAEAKVKEAEAEYKSKIEELNSQREEAEKKIKADTSEELKKRRADYDKMNTEISTLTLKVQEINLQKIEAIAAAERVCHDRALTQLDTYLKDRRAALNASQLSSGSVSKLFSSTGKNRQEKNADFAQKYYDSCLRDRNHIDKISSIKRVHAFQLKQINDTIMSARAAQAKLIQEISGDETQNRFKDQIEGVYKMHEKEVNKAGRALQTLAQNENAKIEKLRRKVQTLQQRLKVTAAGERDKILTYNAAKKSSGGRGKDDPGAKFLEQYGSMGAASSVLVSACGCDDTNDWGKAAGAELLCKEANEILCTSSPSSCIEIPGHTKIGDRRDKMKKKAAEGRRKKRK